MFFEIERRLCGRIFCDFCKERLWEVRRRRNFFFASCLLQGKEVPKNTGEAVNWCEKAAHQGYDKAIQCLDDIKYSHVCEKIARNMVCTQDEVAVLERMSMRGTIGAEGLLVNARFGEPLRLPPAGIQHRPVRFPPSKQKNKDRTRRSLFFWWR